jgi:hypothetical protein
MSKRIVILGSGESGTGAAKLAKIKGFDVFVSDKGAIPQKYKDELLEMGVAFEENQHTEALILNADEIIKSPGIPEKNELIKQLRKQGTPIINELEFASRYTNAYKICITGTNGKTTTTSLTYHLLKKAGLNVAVAGNIGISMCRMVADGNYDYYVLEISSFQLDDMYDFKADIAVLCNITPDHLDRYEYKLENYIASKFRITQNQTEQDLFIYCADDELTAALQGSHLRILRGPAIDRDGSATHNGAVFGRVGVYLQRELSRGRHDDAQRRAFGCWPLGHAARENWEEEAERLTRSRLRYREHVAPGDCDRPRRRLHGRRCGKGLRREQLEQRRSEARLGQAQAWGRRLVIVNGNFVCSEICSSRHGGGCGSGGIRIGIEFGSGGGGGSGIQSGSLCCHVVSSHLPLALLIYSGVQTLVLVLLRCLPFGFALRLLLRLPHRLPLCLPFSFTGRYVLLHHREQRHRHEWAADDVVRPPRCDRETV